MEQLVTLYNDITEKLVVTSVQTLEQLHWCSVYDPANQNWMKKSQRPVWLSKKEIGPAFLHNLLRLVKGTPNPNTCQRRVY